MNNRKINKGYKTLILSKFNEDTSLDKFKDGIIYTLYSDEFNSLKVGFAENEKFLEKKLSSEALILLDMKKGKKKDLCLLIRIDLSYYLFSYPIKLMPYLIIFFLESYHFQQIQLQVN